MVLSRTVNGRKKCGADLTVEPDLAVFRQISWLVLSSVKTKNRVRGEGWEVRGGREGWEVRDGDMG